MKNIFLVFFALASAASPWKEQDANQLEFVVGVSMNYTLTKIWWNLKWKIRINS